MWCGTAAAAVDGVSASAQPFSPPVAQAVAPLPSARARVLIDVNTTSIPLRLAIAYANWSHLLADKVAFQLVHHPRRARMLVGAFLVVLVMGFGGHAANALFLDDLVTNVEGGTTGWLGNAMDLANDIFYAMGGSVIMYNIIAHFMQHDSVRGLFQTLMRTCLALGFPFALMQLAPRDIGTVFCWAQIISGRITGGAWGGGVCDGVAGVTPDSLFYTGVNIGWNLLQTVFNLIHQSHFVFSLGNMNNDLGYDITQLCVDGVFLLCSLGLCLIMIAVFAFIAVELIMAYLQTYFALPLGAWALGFLAVPQLGFASGYISALMRTVIRFVAVLAMVTFAQNIGEGWITQLAALKTGWNLLAHGDVPVNIGALKVIIETALSAIGLLYLVTHLPRMAEAAMSGHPVLTGGNAVMGGIAFASTGAGGAVGGAAGGIFGAGTGAIAAAAKTGKIEDALGGAFVGGAKGASSGFKAGSARGSQGGRAFNRMVAGMRGGMGT